MTSRLTTEDVVDELCRGVYTGQAEDSRRFRLGTRRLEVHLHTEQSRRTGASITVLDRASRRRGRLPERYVPLTPTRVVLHDPGDAPRCDLTVLLKELVLASFSLNRLDEHPALLLDPLAAAVARGVRVRLFVRAMNHRDRHRHQARLLHDLGVELVADDLNHAKAAVADDRHGLLFSANFDAEHGLRPGTGIEIGVRLDGTPALPELSRYLAHAMNCATRRYVPVPTTRQLHDGLAAPWHTPWSYGETLEVSCSPDLWRALADAPGPALWTRQAGAPVEITVGTLRLAVRPEGVSVSNGAAVPDLAQWMRSPPGNTERGFCPARIRCG